MTPVDRQPCFHVASRLDEVGRTTDIADPTPVTPKTSDRAQDNPDLYTQMRQAANRYAEAMIRHATVWLAMRDAPLHENGKLYDTLYQYADEMDRLHKELKHLTREIAERSMA